MSPEYWSQLLDKTSVMIDGCVVGEGFLGELQQSVQPMHHECELHLKLDRDGYLFFPGLIDTTEIQAARNAVFKQKTAYDISACLMGSEMCIRDRSTVMSLKAIQQVNTFSVKRVKNPESQWRCVNLPRGTARKNK